MSNSRTTRGRRAKRSPTPQTRLRVSSPADMLAAIPYLLGFHPADSLVVLGIGGPRLRVQFTSRADLPTAGDEGAAERTAAYVADVVAAQPVDQAILVAYGPEPRAGLALDHAKDALEERDIRIRDALRAEGGRYWSYECTNPSCCPPEGSPYEIHSSAIAAQATVAGCVALPDRRALERSLSSIGGVTRDSMRQATARAEERLESWVRNAPDVPAARRRVREEGRAQVRAALDRFGVGNAALADDETASLSVLLSHLRVRDEAWLSIDDDSRHAHLDLWAYVVRRAEEGYVPGPASLLAFAAWQDGHGALASIAVERALRADPEYSMAHLMGEALSRGLDPGWWKPQITAEELPDLYGQVGRAACRGSA